MERVGGWLVCGGVKVESLLLGKEKTSLVGLKGPGGAPLFVLLGLGEIPLLRQLGMGETPFVVEGMMTFQSVLHDQSLSQSSRQSAVLSVVLDCHVPCP